MVVSVCLFALSAHAQISMPAAEDSVAVAPISSPDRSGIRRGLDDTGSVLGVASTMSGSPLRDCRIELRDAGRGTVLATLSTGISGNFEFRNVPNGKYEVIAISGLNQAHDSVQVLNTAVTVELRIGAQSEEPDGAPSVSVWELKIPEKARREWEKGQQALVKNKLQDARKHAERALAIAPEYARALTLRGILKLGEGDNGSGITDLQQAIKNDPDYAMGHIALGAGLNARRDFEEAGRALQRGMSLDPNAWQGWFELTKTDIALGKFQDALKHIVRAHELNKDYPPIHLLMAHALLGNSQYSRAIEEFELFLSEEPNSPHAAKAREGLGAARAYMQSAAR